jgi:hypothetical protein
MRFRGSPWFAAAALAVLLGLVIQVAVSAANEEGLFPTAASRVFNVFCYFTVQSNIVVGVTSALLFVRPQRENEAFRVLRLAGLAAIVVTFVIYHTALSHLVDLDGWAKLADQLLHTLVPVLTVVGWGRGGPARAGREADGVAGTAARGGVGGVHARARGADRFLPLPLRRRRAVRLREGGPQHRGCRRALLRAHAGGRGARPAPRR